MNLLAQKGEQAMKIHIQSPANLEVMRIMRSGRRDA
jgi:hypothetical protein